LPKYPGNLSEMLFGWFLAQDWVCFIWGQRLGNTAQIVKSLVNTLGKIFSPNIMEICQKGCNVDFKLNIEYGLSRVKKRPQSPI
jgi:hypothetical protein